MKISIQQEREAFVEAIVRDGRYPSADAVIDEGLRLLEERERKLQDLGATIDASIARGGSNTDEDVGRYLEERRRERRKERAVNG